MAMNSIEQARRIGGQKAAAGFLWMFLLMEVMAFFVETRENFAIGIRHFWQMQADRLSIGTVVVMLIAVYFLGRMAGKQILVGGRSHLVVALVNALYTVVVCVGYVWVVAYYSHIYIESWLQMVALLALISGCIWMIAARAIKRAGA